MTNRDKFNGIHNDVLADILCVINDGVVRCKFCAYEKGDCFGNSCFGKSCFDGIKRWLNFMTNRNEFNEMTNAELADILRRIFFGDKCKFCSYTSGDCFGKSCADGIKMWLSAPCASEPENPPADKIDKPRKHLPRETLNSKTMINNVTADNVNHPSHYTSGRIEVIDFIEDKELGFHLGNAVKYISRAGRKNPDKVVEDLRKAVWYINRQIERLER